MFKDLLFSVVDMTIPRFKWKKKKLNHWFSYETIHLIRQKRRLYSHIQSSAPPLPSLLRKYRSLSNIVCGMTRWDTKAYTKKLLRFSKNPRKFWAWVNPSKGRHAPIPPVTVSGTQITDDTTNI